jgi:3-dehydroquinate dehydratase
LPLINFNHENRRGVGLIQHIRALHAAFAVYDGIGSKILTEFECHYSNVTGFIVYRKASHATGFL